MSSERRFTDQQVAIVLRTAAELQERDGVPAAVGKGLTQSQLEQIGAEAGIDGAAIRRAVARLDANRESEGRSAFLGAPASVVAERVVDGEIGTEDFERFVVALRRITGQLGESTGVGRLFGWKGLYDDAPCEVSISSEAGVTTVRVRLSGENHIMGQFMVKGMLGGVGGGIVVGGFSSMVIGGAGLVVSAAILGASYVMARRGFQRDHSLLRGKAADLADALAAICAERDVNTVNSNA